MKLVLYRDLFIYFAYISQVPLKRMTEIEIILGDFIALLKTLYPLMLAVKNDQPFKYCL